LGLLATGDQYGHRFRLTEPRQVMEVAVLAIGVLNVVIALPNRCRGQDRNGIAPHEAHQLPAPLREFLFRSYDGLCCGPNQAARFVGFLQCRGAPGDEGWSRNGLSSSKTSCTPTRTNSTSSA